ncbi:DUF861 domain-containing protein [Leucobacter sp. OH1287]|nr:DUF861 domain-containing protein [Leucobacter sp. OH1287]
MVSATTFNVELEPVSASDTLSGSPSQGFVRLGALVPSPAEGAAEGAAAAAAAAAADFGVEDQASAAELASSRDSAAEELAEVGIWELTAGTVTDTEVAEVFVVISGSATIELLEVPGDPAASGQQLLVSAGDVVRLVAGTKTRWTVAERIRKIYIAG